MLIGPVFTREVTIAPRRDRTFVARAVYGGLLLLLISTAWLVMAGTQLITDTGDFSRFGMNLFRLITPFQLVLMLFFSAVLSAGAVAQEKDRKTLLLLLLTRLSNSELVLGKLLASLLEVLLFLAISVPIFLMMALLGGISYPQIIKGLLVTLFGMLACGSVGSCVALWREKTFQAVSATVLILVLWLGFWQVTGYGVFGSRWFGCSTRTIAEAMSPWLGVFAAMKPVVVSSGASLFAPIYPSIAALSVITLLVNLLAIAFVRVWNPSREVRIGAAPEEDTWRKEAVEARLAREAQQRRSAATGIADVSNPYEDLTHNLFAQEAEHPDKVSSDDQELIDPATGKMRMDPKISAAPGKVRPVWDNPIIWREIRTKAYGRRALIIRGVYFLLFVMSALALHGVFAASASPTISQIAGPLLPMLVLSMILVNAQAVTSLTSERDGGTFTLLLVSDISPKEFVWGKLGGTFYNMKEIVILPLLLCGYIWYLGAISALNALFLFAGLAILYFFVAVVGVHIGMQYTNTRSAVATSLGVVFFLFIGIATCIWIMLAFSGSFESQLQPFLAFMIGGGVGLYIALGLRNPSSAIALASFIAPPATFYAITSFLLGQSHWVFFAIAGAYAFATIAMLIPAIDEFDVATGRTTAD
ncbi:MAG: ABC transporter permease subunit [Thermoguttaceae bacterium]|nr:ABC transporter permease subunit [Thermoguttaceae bacterium]MBR3219331.1 ABC transporter permease subunit [Thermoguttaceae bacterium]